LGGEQFCLWSGESERRLAWLSNAEEAERGVNKLNDRKKPKKKEKKRAGQVERN
jgi:hypothetical protein